MKPGVIGVLLGCVCAVALAQSQPESQPQPDRAAATTAFPRTLGPFETPAPWPLNNPINATARFNGLLRGLAISGAIVHFRELKVGGDQVRLQGRVVGSEPRPGCGVMFLASPVTYEILTGPEHLRGLRVVVQVPCIEMPLVKGDVADFEPGDTHEILLSGLNPYESMYHVGDIFLLSAVRTGYSVIDPDAVATTQELALGGIRLGLSEAEVIAVLGPPLSREDSADGFLPIQLTYRDMTVGLDEQGVGGIVSKGSSHCTVTRLCPGMNYERVQRVYGPRLREYARGGETIGELHGDGCWLEFHATAARVSRVEVACSP